MPADPDEVAEAREEGVEFRFLAAPAEILGDKHVNAIKVERMALGEPDEKGRCKPVSTGEFDELAVDSVIGAVGQVVDWGNLDTGDLVRGRKNLAEADAITYQSAQPDIFVGGDVYSGPKFAIDAIAAGREGAISLHRYVHPGHSLTLSRNPRDFVALDKDNLELDPECFDRPARQQVRHDKRKVKTMHDDRLPFTEEQVKAEASRCLGCGETYVDQNRCIGCGICTTRCKFDAIHLVRNHPEFAKYYNGDHSKEIVMLSGVKRAGHIAIKELKKAVTRNG